MKLILLAFFISSYGFANEYIKPCFKSNKIAQRAKKDIGFVLTKQDRLKVSGSCLDIFIATTRVSLLKKFLSLNYRGLYKLETSSDFVEDFNTPECTLSLIKVSKSKSRAKVYRLSNKSNLSNSNNTSTQKSSQLLRVQSGKQLRMQIGEDEVSLVCVVRSKSYSIDIQASNKSLELSTSFSLKKGQTRELGSFIEDINRKKRELGINSGINIKKTQGKKKISFSLKAL